MSWLSVLGKIGGSLLGGIGAGAGGGAKDAATNRDAKVSAQMDLMKLLLDRDKGYQDQQVQYQQEGRAGTSDAWKKLLAAEHLGTPGARPMVSPYGLAGRQPTQDELFGADQMKLAAIKRLQGGNPMTAPTLRPVTANDAGQRVDPNLLNAGGWEKAGKILGPFLTFLGQQKKRPTGTGNVTIITRSASPVMTDQGEWGG